jgi:hypothetical protein
MMLMTMTKNNNQKICAVAEMEDMCGSRGGEDDDGWWGAVVEAEERLLCGGGGETASQ